jgi:hypothetical protein
MVIISSQLEGMQMQYREVEKILQQDGWVIGGNWEYGGGSFDYVFEKDPSYRTVRLPFRTLVGNLDGGNPIIEFQSPYLLVHEYQDGLDDHVQVGVFSSLVNQFSEPMNKDAEVTSEDVEIGEEIIKKTEENLIK